MSKRLFTHPIGISLSLSAIAFLCLLTPALLNRQTPPANTDDFQLPSTTRAVVIDPITQAVTLKAIDSD